MKRIDPFRISDNSVVGFLANMFEEGYGYSSINTARAAISSLNDLGSCPLVCRFMRGVFNLRPSRPRYTFIWDVSIVLNYLRTLSPAAKLNLPMLSAKLVTLCALVTGHRCQSLHVLDITNMHISSSKAVFYIQTLLKTNSPKNPASVITLAAYREDRRICVFICLKQYLKRARLLRTSNQLFISSQSPHNGVTKDTLARWIKLTLKKSGIDTSIFKAHSTRAAAASAAARTSDVSLVLRSAGWTKETTFAKFYNKPIDNNLSQSNFAHSVLKSKSKSVSL
ncbi:tyrosine recombinase [Plakobranchus ocellatus]|uniref:Tyrosine recombinase n=1 Tax=Plakobranchus ocellatus TaxID=259542 RepID=A0AAV3XUY5_9GAST|nr:tyrosine recombinase [Plakobranchus ocellatus]